MENKPSAFRRHLLRYRPPGARYYYLVRCHEDGTLTRVPTSRAFQATPGFQGPAAKPGRYAVAYCQDQHATTPGKSAGTVW